MIDLDGTLVDTAPDLADALNRTLAEFGHPPVSDDTVRMWVGRGGAKLVEQGLIEATGAAPDVGAHARVLSRFLGLYKHSICERSRIYPGVVETLSRLADQGLKIVCVTNKREAMTVPLLKKIGLFAHFSTVVSGDSQDTMKPEPGPLLNACERLETMPRRSVLVGDSDNDILAARAAGMAVIWVTYGYNQGVDLRSMQPDATVDNFADIIDVIHRTD